MRLNSLTTIKSLNRDHKRISTLWCCYSAKQPLKTTSNNNKWRHNCNKCKCMADNRQKWAGSTSWVMAASPQTANTYFSTTTTLPCVLKWVWGWQLAWRITKEPSWEQTGETNREDGASLVTASNVRSQSATRNSTHFCRKSISESYIVLRDYNYWCIHVWEPLLCCRL